MRSTKLLARSNIIRDAWKARNSQPVPPRSNSRPQPPNSELRYGPLAPSRWSKVAGPVMFAGFYR